MNDSVLDINTGVKVGCKVADVVWCQQHSTQWLRRWNTNSMIIWYQVAGFKVMQCA